MRRITHHRNVESAPPLDLYLGEFASRRFISELGGEATVRWQHRSQSGGAGQAVFSRESSNPTEVSTPLIKQGGGDVKTG